MAYKIPLKKKIEPVSPYNIPEGITKEDCQAYEEVRVSGVTNMFDVKRVEQLSGLSREKILKIMKNYSQLNEKYKFREPY